MKRGLLIFLFGTAKARKHEVRQALYVLISSEFIVQSSGSYNAFASVGTHSYELT